MLPSMNNQPGGPDRVPARARAAFGATIWLLLPAIGPPFGSLEHTFLTFPLIAAPLALQLLKKIVPRDFAPPLVLRAQPVAAALLAASFVMERGAISGLLAAPWLLLSVLSGIGGIRAQRAAGCFGANLEGLSFRVAHVFPVIGAIWLLLSRFGLAPRGFQAGYVFLAAVHFHFRGFALQILLGATGRRIDRSRKHRASVIAAIAALPLIAAGRGFDQQLLVSAGVASVITATLVLALEFCALGRQHRWFAIPAAAIAAGMFQAGMYGLGELLGQSWISLESMAQLHAPINALGFVTCGLLVQVASTSD